MAATDDGMVRSIRRVRPVIDPANLYSWHGLYENWSRMWVNKHFWKVRAHIPTKEDALQECALIFARCIRHYAHVAENPAHFMSLFQVSVMNDWITFAKKSTQRTPLSVACEDFEHLAQHQTTYNDGPLLALLSSASAELKQVLKIIASAPSELLEMMFRGRNLAECNLCVCRMSGVKADHDVLAELRKLLS